MNHLVKLGLLGVVGRFHSTELIEFSRGQDVICRTERGLEVGQVLCSLDQDQGPRDGELLRLVSVDDRLIIERLDRFRDRAFLACQARISELGYNATLVDVEHLFDGEALYFYFLGPVSDEVNQLTEELAATYERKVRFRKFAETLASGCGPGCGTTASKCSSSGGGCGSCSVGCGIRAATS